MRNLLAVAALFAVAVVASAQDGEKKPKGEKGKGRFGGVEIFGKIDSNGDGKISKEEFQAFQKDMRAKAEAKGKTLPDKGKGGKGGDMFDRLDADKDGFISKEEWSKMGDRMRKGKGKGDFKGKGKGEPKPPEGDAKPPAPEPEKA